MSLLDNYVVGSRYDELFDEELNIKSKWSTLAPIIEKIDAETLAQRQSEIDWRLEENGVTYNVYNAPDGNNRKWNLDPIPFVMSEEEWDFISKGLEQRAKLLDLLFKDIYGEQKLIKEGIVPAEVLYANKSFIRSVLNFKNRDYFTLHYYAADIARGADGKFWLMADKTQSPSGLGYAIENRLTMNSVASELYPGVEIKKIASFLDGFKGMLRSSCKNNTNPFIAFLTPGPFNETYFEHSYLSAFLGMTLVQGEDLVCRENTLWLKSLNSLKRVDAIIRRVDERYCDPLELKHDSKLGIAGLLDAARHDNISIFNPIGVGILENVGFNPFMESICRFFLDEELILPQIATWWCGQPKELEYVIENIDKLLIKKIDKTNGIKTYCGESMSKKDRLELIKSMRLQPYLYAAQERISFATTPSYIDGRIEPRSCVIRAFSYLDKEAYRVMPSGLVRVSTAQDTLKVSNQQGGVSKDLWVLGKSEPFDINYKDLFKNTEHFDTRLDNVSAKRAENLFWLGRYLARAIFTARDLRHTIKNFVNMNRYENSSNMGEVQKMLNISLTHLTMTYPGFLSETPPEERGEIAAIINDKTRTGSLSFTISMLANANMNVKNILTIDSWRLFERLQKEWIGFNKKSSKSSIDNISALENLLLYLMAYKELIDESLFKDQGAVVYEIGFKLESALLLISKVRSLLTLRLSDSLEYDILDALLNSYESYNSYRTYYKSTIELENVLDFLIFDPQYPKSLVSIVHDLLHRLKDLPKQEKSSAISAYEEPVFRAYSLLRLSTPKSVLACEKLSGVYCELEEFLAELTSYFINASNELTKRYF